MSTAAGNSFRIRPAKRPMLSQQGSEQSWELLRNAIQHILQRNAFLLSFEEIYRTAYTMILHKHGDRLYEGVQETIRTHLLQVVRDRILPALSDTDSGYLSVVHDCWKDHRASTEMIRDVLMYVDRVYVRSANVPKIYDMSSHVFRDHVVFFHEQENKTLVILQRIRQAMCSLIHRERIGEAIDRMLIKSLVEMLTELGIVRDKKESVYQHIFEAQFLKESTEYYQTLSAEYLASHDAIPYLRMVNSKLRQENERVDFCLAEDTRLPLLVMLHRELLETPLEMILQKSTGNGSVDLALDEKRLDDLALLYRMCGRVTCGRDKLKQHVCQRIRKLGTDLNESHDLDAPTSAATNNNNSVPPKQPVKQRPASANAQKASTWVTRVSELKQKFDEILLKSFEDDKQFEAEFNGPQGAFSSFINRNPYAPKYLTYYMDEHLKKAAVKLDLDEIETIASQTVKLFQFLDDKDVFERNYNELLAKRLLASKQYTEDFERLVISKLRTECGSQFTSKMEGMFKDIAVSADAMADFKEHLRNTGRNLACELSVNVLTSIFWPIASDTPPAFPPELQAPMDAFTVFYVNRHSGRKLTWKGNMGTVDLKMRTKSTKFEVSVSTYQAILLLLFDRKPEWTLEELLQESCIPERDCIRSLQSLACGKIKLLVKSPKSRDIDTGDRFQFNEDFTSPQYRIKVPLIAVASTKAAVDQEDSHRLLRQVLEDRKHIIDAAIVRVMKSRKQLEHNNLIAQVTDQLKSRFAPDPATIKKQIEVLIEREYLSRAEDDRRLYNYVA